ncbi:non-ribosomal peptide synthetase [Umezawaea tangerina]|uniref:non-ribosomal peptide synthetase n=1 Tax=Umezawaea tangerina TaxID=84725 RepID=UPI0011B20861|nr:non-ribosomal peptide synthetase [Umezawaea tangerina]
MREATRNSGSPPRTAWEVRALAAWSLALVELAGEAEVRFHRGDAGVDVPFWPDTPVAEYLDRVAAAAGVDVGEATISVGPDRTGPHLDVRLPTDGTDHLGHASFDPSAQAEVDVRRVLDHFLRLLDQLATAAPVTPVGALSGVGESDRALAVRSGPTTARRTGAVHDRVQDQARATPDAVAVVGDHRSLTYAELVSTADRVAAALHRLGVRTGDLVPLVVDRGPLAVAAMLGIMRAGAAYVPVERTWPRRRVEQVLAAVAADVAVVSPDRAEEQFATTGPAHLVWLDDDEPAGTVHAAAGRAGVRVHGLPVAGTPWSPPEVGPDELAYVLFTSGSTGVPKGVQVPHGAVTNLLDWANDTFAVGPADLALLVTPLAFDLSVYSVFGPLLVGAGVRMPAEEAAVDPARLLDLLRTEPVTVWNSAPAALAQLEPLPTGGAPALRLVLLSGDWIPVALPTAVHEAFPGTEVVALGGPTETTVWSNYFRFDEVDPAWTSIPYGHPIRNVSRYVLDSALRPVAQGVPGDLYVAGDCLARGYLGAPELTAAAFLQDPFGEPGSRMYRTGDRVRLWPDGTMEFLGRLDHQVKVRGHRVELGEVDSALASSPLVERGVAHARRDGDTAELVGYVVPASDTVTAADVRAALALVLPPHAVPTAVVLLDRIPLTDNGKVDRRALPAPTGRGGGRALSATEARIGEVWAETLGVGGIGADDNFYDLGGHSLAATRAIARLRHHLGVRVPLRALVTEPSLAGFAALVDELLEAEQAR